jgi:hypothetical protein
MATSTSTVPAGTSWMSVQRPTMGGGSREYILDIAQKFATPIQLYVLIGLFLAITFVKLIPLPFRSQAGTIPGRLLLFLVTIYIGQTYSWINGLLMALFVLLLLSLSPRNEEGFQNGGDSIKLITDKKKWFVEQILKEEPVAIEKETVKTMPIQDNSNSQASFVGQGGSK